MVARGHGASGSPLVPAYAGTIHAGQSAGAFSGRPFDLHRFRVVFPDRWSAFLARHFRGPAHVAVFFDVDEKTARNWLSGLTGPSGFAVGVAMRCIPDASAELFAEAA